MPSTIFSKPLNKQVAQNAADISALSASMANANGAMAIVATGNTAPKAISAGQFVLWSGGLHTANSAIASGETLSSSNLTAVPDGGLNALNSKMPFPPYVAKGIMGSTEDFNNITTSGTYQSNGTGSNTHAPISGDDNGDLVVFGEHGRKLQLWVSAYNNKMLIRQQKNSTWSAWDEIALNSKIEYSTSITTSVLDYALTLPVGTHKNIRYSGSDYSWLPNNDSGFQYGLFTIDRAPSVIAVEGYSWNGTKRIYNYYGNSQWNGWHWLVKP